MIDRTFQHLPGIGPVTEARLRAAGIDSWSALLACRELPMGPRKSAAATAELERCAAALAATDIGYLVTRFSCCEHWRILGRYFDRASFFDCETTGFGWAAQITVICCYHRGRVRSFVQGENLDDFLDLLEEIELLVSFNGTSFDVPQVLQQFHIPALPCPHVDLRWIAYHCNMRGGLKRIEQDLGIRRPVSLQGLGGEEAIWLWQAWEADDDVAARDLLIRYCGADTVTLPLVAAGALAGHGLPVVVPAAEEMWARLANDLPGHDAHPEITGLAAVPAASWNDLQAMQAS